MAKLFGLTAEQQKRLARVADKVEGQPIQRANQQSGTSKPSPSFWVELTEEDPDNPGRYAWKMVDYVDHEWTDRDPSIESPEGEYTAIEANLGSGMVGQRVEVHFYGYDAAGKPRYLFGSPPPVILAKITGNVALRTSDSISIGGGAATTCTIQWKYAWEEVRLLSDGSMETVDGGRSGTTSEGFALCEAEYANTEDGKNVGGIDITGDSYPEGFRPVPIPAGTPVRLTRRTDISGEDPVTFYTFEGWQTKHDGECEAEE